MQSAATAFQPATDHPAAFVELEGAELELLRGQQPVVTRHADDLVGHLDAFVRLEEQRGLVLGVTRLHQHLQHIHDVVRKPLAEDEALALQNSCATIL